VDVAGRRITISRELRLAIAFLARFPSAYAES
jgi:hypothetical protein